MFASGAKRVRFTDSKEVSGLRDDAVAEAIPAASRGLLERGRLLSGLTAEQREVVCHGEGPLLVVAGPGAGKTRVLVDRIAWLLQSGIARAWEVLAVTFSVRAADELRLRLQELLGVAEASGVRAATFHSVCARLLREHAHHVGRSAGWTVYDQTEVRRTIEWLTSERQRGEAAHALHTAGLAAAEIAREIAGAKNRLLSPAAYERAAGHQAAALIAGTWRELNQELRRRDAIDLDDMLALAVRLLSERPHILRAQRERFRWLLVDELQDTCPAQLELACLLAGPGGNVTAVGDADQCVFSFRQADPEGMRKLGERFPGHRKLMLRQSFRSRAEILAAAGRCVQRNPRREGGALIATRGGGGHVGIKAFQSDRDEAEWIANHVGSVLGAGVEAREVLILARTGRASVQVQQALRHAGIPHRVAGALGLYERAEIRDALAYLTVLCNPKDVSAFSRAVSSPRRGVGARSVSRIVALARERDDGELICCCESEEAPGLLPAEPAREKLRNFARGLAGARGELGQGRSLAHVTVAALTMRGGLVPYHQQIRDRSPSARRRRDAERVLEDLRSLVRHVQAYEQRDQNATLSGFLELAAGLGSRQLEDGQPDDRVTVSTIHRSKGGEGRLVIVLGCEERLLPIRHALETAGTSALEEERRLFYVACTRAKDSLMLSYCAVRDGRPTGGASRFLAEAELSRSGRMAA